MTDGEILPTDDVQYYSTSCLSEKRDDLGDEDAFRAFLLEDVEENAEYGSAWVRWQTEISEARILERLADEYEIRAESLDEITVELRSERGQALLLRIVAAGETVEIEGEYAIRQFLSPGDAEVEQMDGTIVSGMQLLPSAFFYLEPIKTGESGFCIYGGGYGHGNGMSQCGAAQMAAEGAFYTDILEYYYGSFD